MLFFISELFLTYISYLECSIYFLIKHIGILLAFVIYYIYISVGYELGIFGEITENNKKICMVSSFSMNSIDSIGSDISDIYDIYYSLENSTSSISSLDKNSSEVIIKMKNENEISSSKSLIINEFNSRKNSTDSDNFNYKIKRNISQEKINSKNGSKSDVSNSIGYESFRNKNKEIVERQRNLLSNIINKNLTKNVNNTKKDIKNKNKKTIHKNIRKAHSLFIEIAFFYPFFILITIILTIIYSYMKKNMEENTIQGKNGQWFYKCSLETSDMAYNSLELMILIFTLIKGKYVVRCNCVYKCTRYITYSTIIGIVFGPTVNVRNDANKYFKIKKYKKCLLHNSLSCGCPLEETDENLEPLIKKYILFYKFCTTNINIKHGKIRYLSIKSKLNIVKK
ncbi:hypothetical protein BCR36DRAFT_276147 [Piromyces finnis]|uniref:G-protein coupled receptors family 3 profile domain-containing protein n=1 Tax=Piromyces finnis TaxID=1754191 RepID=A0A1Y1VL66_9FUNG|nr:hypothetical protein BCR36DRAFT_276147 [Piromyces finnis]|eukprot:ORX59219.1 hypothetical protein BCR36DRAFT_276147 [Piromyces finnis]